MILQNRKKSALVIIAHPDDETIWMGGTILKYPKNKWTILCMSRAQDKDRSPKFFNVCKKLGVKGIIDNMDDEGLLEYDELVRQAKKIIKKHSINNFDLVFTHGKNGEYGHQNHVAIHEAVDDLKSEGSLRNSEIMVFHYRKKRYNTNFSKIISQKNSDFDVKLSKKIFNQKIKIMTDIYGFNLNGPDVGYCTNPESFKLLK